MIEIITDVEKLAKPSEPLTFMSDEGAKTEEGTETLNGVVYTKYVRK